MTDNDSKNEGQAGAPALLTEDLTSKSKLPVTHAVVVVEYREGQPWPMLAVEFRGDGHVSLKGPQHAGNVVGHMIEATRLAMRQIADGDLRAALTRCGPPEGETTTKI
ncbi:hypothetical protein [Prosthecobacter sp.]|uniref:hypothetical protein n=1 Tax=Prosthecobacter sp. TaxID=1965333 RepID=UPI0037836E72